MIIRGWCFDETGGITGIRLRSSDRVLHGVVGMPRSDVKAALAAAPDDNTGFEIRGTLPSGQQRIIIEAQLTGHVWTPLFEREITIKRQLLPLWLGGGEWKELMFFQMPAHMAHPPHPVQVEKFPARKPGLMLPKISIVTPSYQQARYLGQTMRSVLNQAVPVEYVVQDGGSTDGSAELIQQFAPRLHAWASERDAGQADAIARGFTKTSGRPDDLMAWINSDDYYQPGALAFVADYFAQHPEVDVLYGNRIVVDEESKEIARWFLPAHDAEVLRLNDFVPQETLFWRRRVWEKAGGLDTGFQFALDWDLLLRFQAADSRIVRVPYFIACFRAHAAQKTAAFMHSTGQSEITRLRERTHSRTFLSHEIENHPRLMTYLRKSAFHQFLWSLGIRGR
ncbi:glycosyltransferase family 2 protein [Oleiharenicola lentus]|uniref:glycosyltransferase family 2 protein n=1 Tax=Oleiharenicola lentus TaxID=2508720 RepID=UPI003F668ED1